MAGKTRLDLLIHVLAEATAEGRASWHIGDNRQIVVFDGPKGTVVIRPLNADEKLPYVLEVLSTDNEVLDVRTTSYTADQSDLTPLSRELEELYQLARDSCLSTVVDAILEDLGQPSTPPGSGLHPSLPATNGLPRDLSEN